jgi:SAM-dependent methyltransferase
MSTTTDTTTSTTAEVPDWAIAGDAWGHAAADWAYLFEPYARDAIEHLFDALEIGEGTDLLDLACGSGYALARAARVGALPSGIDASSQLVEIARRRVPHGDLRAGDMFALPWADDSFDVITSFNGIWGGCTDALCEARRVLREGGRIGLTFWGPGSRLDLRDWFIALGTSTPAVAEELMSLANIGSPGVVEEMLTVAGFTDVVRTAASAVLEFPDESTTWRALRSPGVVLPALEEIGEAALRERLMAAVEKCRADDGTYRIVNELTCVTACVA